MKTFIAKHVNRVVGFGLGVWFVITLGLIKVCADNEEKKKHWRYPYNVYQQKQEDKKPKED